MLNSKQLIVLHVLILIVLILVGALVWRSNCTSKLSKWTEYADKKEGYSVKVPARLEDLISTWDVAVTVAENNKEIAGFVTRNYGKGCAVEETAEEEINTISGSPYKVVKINATDADEKGACPVDRIYRIFYNPKSNKIASVKANQGCTFVGDKKEDVCYDAFVLDSFTFLK